MKEKVNFLILLLLVFGFLQADQSISKKLVQSGKNGNCKLGRSLVEQGADINIREVRTGDSLLHWAIKWKREDIAKYLISKNCDPNIQNKNGITPLHLAVDNMITKTVKLLIRADANSNLKTRMGLAPLHYAVMVNSSIILKILIKSGANVNALDNEGLTPLHYATQNEKHFNIARILIENGANLNIKNRYGNTPLEAAIRANSTRLVKLLLHNGANIKLTNSEKKTPLSMAEKSGYKRIVSLLSATEKYKFKDLRPKVNRLNLMLIGDSVKIETEPLDKNVKTIKYNIEGDSVEFFEKTIKNPSQGNIYRFFAVDSGISNIVIEKVKLGKGKDIVEKKEYMIKVIDLQAVENVSIAEIIKKPNGYFEKFIRISGYNRGWGAPKKAKEIKGTLVMRSDWALEDSSGAVYITGLNASRKDENLFILAEVIQLSETKWAVRGDRLLKCRNSKGL